MLQIKQWTIGTGTVPAIDGRELHKALGVGRDFSTWINTRIQGYPYIDGEDYTSFLADRGAGTPAKEYLLILPMAAELCLLDRSLTGSALRRYILDQQSAQNCSCLGAVCADRKPMELLTIDDMESYKADLLKACRKCKTPFQGVGEHCQACNNFDEARERKADLVEQRNGLNVTSNELVQCLIEREGNTTMTVPGSYGAMVTFQRNKFGHAVARVENPLHRSNILKSTFYRSYMSPEKEAA